MKQNKYKYLKVIQQNYGQGWEDVSEYECKSDYTPLEMCEDNPKMSVLRHDFLKYRLKNKATRVISRKQFSK